ncbi:inactive serine/threonine-protein kinase VRK3 [Latimeria chalumnae]|uniref:inactive serine/threonine-protein kinase VRK3 n=1 Tax=Latimeria chalumnae TaxID=7897 RepID=UPI0006D93B4E|nr:PREDICTED: inactive serine/threonine-protein kinase VRK3 [Latimeria chalumnae]|eukprot:XP_014342022.1 PREDICTED: inactive serine/threonine-protein kinase VRK3 [Latimeria chalumnae]
MVNFCPECGQKMEITFTFCPYCGIQLPKASAAEEAIPFSEIFPSTADEVQTEQVRKSHGTKQSPMKTEGYKCSPKKRLPSSPKKNLEDVKSFQTSPISKLISPVRISPRVKRQKTNAVEPLPENAILMDTNNQKWQLIELLTQNDSGILYSARDASAISFGNCEYSLKLNAKDGRLYNEQSFFQRAAKLVKVEKWRKSHSLLFLGIPTCIGFGLHEDKYRFLVFRKLGRSLHSILSESGRPLSEKAVFQLSCRIIDVLEYIHENEYVHADIKDENIYVNPDDLNQVYLAGYSFAFRYCPGGKHVEYREGSRTPHEGTLEFTSLDSHKGAGPSRRSDLENLGYCMMKWLFETLPWSDKIDNPSIVTEQKQRFKVDIPSFLKQCSGNRRIPGELEVYLKHVMALSYDEKPNYTDLKNILKIALQKIGGSSYDPVDLTSFP